MMAAKERRERIEGHRALCLGIARHKEFNFIPDVLPRRPIRCPLSGLRHGVASYSQGVALGYPVWAFQADERNNSMRAAHNFVWLRPESRASGIRLEAALSGLHVRTHKLSRKPAALEGGTPGCDSLNPIRVIRAIRGHKKHAASAPPGVR